MSNPSAVSGISTLPPAGAVPAHPARKLISRRNLLWPWMIALTAGAAAAVQLDPGGAYPSRPEGPGLTTDEIFNVAQGVALWDRLVHADLAGFRQIDAGLHDHPPLGRIWLGFWHEFAALVDPPEVDTGSVVIACGRTGSAAAFALTVLLVGWTASVWHGPLAGALGALAVALMPRLFGHAHLASLETFLNLVWWGALLGVAALAGDPRPRMGRVAACGALFGLVLLTKIQAVLLPIPVAAWMIWRWRGLGAAAAAVWGTVGLAVFFAGWPWLWGDPWGRGLGFLATASDRALVMVWYFGERLADRDVPWHYPFVMTIATVPVGLAALGLAGGWAAFVRPRSDAPVARDLLLAGGGLFPLVVFSLPGVAVYDSERLFLMSFVALALFAGRGAAAALETFQDGWHALTARGGLAALLVWQLLALVQMSPVWLGYYSECVGGPRGAERLGLATTYWGDGLTRTLLLRTADELPDGQPLEVLPVLHPRWLPALLSQTPAFQAREMRLIPFVDERPHAGERWLLMFPRREYCTPGWTDRPPGWEPVAEMRRGGVSYGGLYRWRK